MKREIEERLLVVLEQIAERQTYDLEHRSETAERLATGVTNSVLEVSTVTMPTEGYIQRAYQTTCGAIEIHNSGANRVTVVNSTAGTRPTQGIGVSHVEPGTGRTVNVNSRVVTIWGTAGDLVGIQAFSVGGAGAAGGSL